VKQLFTLAALAALWPATIACGARIDFSTLTSANVSDGNGQTFAWTAAGRSGTVVVQANWANVTQVDGALRTSTRAPASFENPFVGTLEFTFSEPVDALLRATFPSLIRDGLDGGRFERVQASTAEAATLHALVGTTAIYTGSGTNAIIADDQFSETPTTSNWGFFSSGPLATFDFQYTSTSLGLSETFDVFVVPEPAGILLVVLGLIGVAFAMRAKSARPRCSIGELGKLR
jgi:hypothetical protein